MTVALLKTLTTIFAEVELDAVKFVSSRVVSMNLKSSHNNPGNATGRERESNHQKLVYLPLLCLEK